MIFIIVLPCWKDSCMCVCNGMFSSSYTPLDIETSSRMHRILVERFLTWNWRMTIFFDWCCPIIHFFVVVPKPKLNFHHQQVRNGCVLCLNMFPFARIAHSLFYYRQPRVGTNLAGAFNVHSLTEGLFTSLAPALIIGVEKKIFLCVGEVVFAVAPTKDIGNPNRCALTHFLFCVWQEVCVREWANLHTKQDERLSFGWQRCQTLVLVWGQEPFF